MLAVVNLLVALVMSFFGPSEEAYEGCVTLTNQTGVAGEVCEPLMTVSGRGEKPSVGQEYELCAMYFPGEGVVGTTEKPCADASPSNGVSINGYVLQACTHKPQTTFDLCFTTSVTKDTIYYYIQAR